MLCPVEQVCGEGEILPSSPRCFFCWGYRACAAPLGLIRGQGRAGGELGNGSRRGLTGWPGGPFPWGPGGNAEVGFAVPPALGHVSVLPSCSLMTGLCICSPRPPEHSTSQALHS